MVIFNVASPSGDSVKVTFEEGRVVLYMTTADGLKMGICDDRDSPTKLTFAKPLQEAEFISANYALATKKPLFELLGPNGEVWKLFADGRAEGFPDHTRLTNRAAPLLHSLLSATLGKQQAPDFSAAV